MKVYDKLIINSEIVLIILVQIFSGKDLSYSTLIPAVCAVLLLILNRIRKKNDQTGTVMDGVLCMLEGCMILWSVLFLQPLLFMIPLAVFQFRVFLQFSGWEKYICPAALYVILVVFFLVNISGMERLGFVEYIGLFLSSGVGWLLYRAAERNEEGLKQDVELLQQQVESKNKLLSTLSHELRTPLTVIKSSTEILMEGRPGAVNDTQGKFLHATHDNVMRMIRFMENILAQVKIEHTWFRMKPEPLNLRPTIKKVCRDMQPFIEDRGQTIRYTYPNPLSRAIADKNWIEQVFINLIHNASKHISRGGQIIISVQENEQCIVVSVSDDGSGIRNSDKPKVFSEFYQSEDSGNNQLDGAGIGLTIVKDIVEKHGGKVYLGSVAGLGTTLSFTLPKEV